MVARCRKDPNVLGLQENMHQRCRPAWLLTYFECSSVGQVWRHAVTWRVEEAPGVFSLLPSYSVPDRYPPLVVPSVSGEHFDSCLAMDP